LEASKMASFMGMFQYSIDNKGRINIPAKLRKCFDPESNDSVVMTRGFDKCIYIYPLNEWNELEKGFQKLNAFKEKDRFFQRAWFMWANQQELDSQSRISISKELLEYANIKSAVVIIGQLDRIEVWDPEILDSYMKSRKESIEEIAEIVMSEKNG
jgi:MraZ protein